MKVEVPTPTPITDHFDDALLPSESQKIIISPDDSLTNDSFDGIDENIRAEDASILYWVVSNGIKTEKGEPLDFTDRLFLLDILSDWSKEIVWKKCSQVGGSVIFNIKSLFALSKFGWNIIYTMPSETDVQDFVKTKTNPIIIENRDVLVGMSSDSVYLKQIGNRNLFFQGTISKTAAISSTADLVIHDEISRSDQSKIKQYESRTKASAFKGKWQFSNPTTEKDVLDERWHLSDKKEWFVTCDNKHTQMLAWPESVCRERKEYQCSECKVELTREQRRTGHWQKTRESDISGYHTSHLMAPWISAEEILKDADGDQEYFYNFILGEPYNPGDLSITRGFILDNWTPKNLETGKWYLGVDVGNIKHWVLGSEKGIIKVGKFSKWSDLDDLIAHYKPIMVIDAMPDTTMSRYYVETHQNTYMSFFQENTSNPQTLVWWGENEKRGIVYSHRNRILDQLIDYIIQAKCLFALPSDRLMKEYVDHWLTMRRVKSVNSRGVEFYEWVSTTDVDHFALATLYWYLAVETGGSGEVFTLGNETIDPAIDNSNRFVSFGGMLGDTGLINNDDSDTTSVL